MEDLWVRGEDRGKGDGSCGYMPRIESLLSEEIEIYVLVRVDVYSWGVGERENNDGCYPCVK